MDDEFYIECMREVSQLQGHQLDSGALRFFELGIIEGSPVWRVRRAEHNTKHPPFAVVDNGQTSN